MFHMEGRGQEGSRERQPGQAGVQLPGLQRWLADFHVESTFHISTLQLLFPDLTCLGLQEPSLASPACFQSHCFWFSRGYFSLTASLGNGDAWENSGV